MRWRERRVHHVRRRPLLLLPARGGSASTTRLEWRSCRREARVATVTVMRVCRRGPMWSTTVPIRIRIVRPTAAATGVVIVGRIGGRAVGIVRRLVMLLVVLIIRRRPVIGHELNELRDRVDELPFAHRRREEVHRVGRRALLRRRAVRRLWLLAVQGLFGHRRRLAGLWRHADRLQQRLDLVRRGTLVWQAHELVGLANRRLHRQRIVQRELRLDV